ncbi:MAG TPA: anthranilate synthase component I [Anaerolineaceae bacterium]
MVAQIFVRPDDRSTTTGPLVRELPADLETPASVYLKLAGQGPSFLLESVTGGENLARYSFIGVKPSRAYIVKGEILEIHDLINAGVKQLPILSDPLDLLRAEFARYRSAPQPGLPRFTGGLVGYLGYEMMRYFEPGVPLKPHPELPDAIYLLVDSLVAFDHAFGKMLLIANAFPGEDGVSDLAAAQGRLDELERSLSNPLPAQPTVIPPASTAFQSNLTRAEFTDAVCQAKEHITAGDIFQVVLSQRLTRATTANPFSIYRALRRLNPSPYMFFFNFDRLAGSPPLTLIGASPEMHVRLEGQVATLRPIAGTRPRGTTPAQDGSLENELLADPKERAEHVMLVDLARNDLGRVCEFGSVHVPEQMVVERYSHVMHIVSQAEGKLCPGLDAFDLLRATFPAGTVSGAPKIRAMQIIRDLEKSSRGVYAGATGYIAANGAMDTCITLRTLVMRGQEISLQAGAGIVADSDPEAEYQETLNKASALAQAVAIAEGLTGSPIQITGA